MAPIRIDASGFDRIGDEDTKFGEGGTAGREVAAHPAERRVGSRPAGLTADAADAAVAAGLTAGLAGRLRGDVAGPPHRPVEAVERGEPHRRPRGQAGDVEEGPVVENSDTAEFARC